MISTNAYNIFLLKKTNEINTYVYNLIIHLKKSYEISTHAYSFFLLLEKNNI